MDENNSSPLADYYELIKSEHAANNAWSAEQAQKAMDYQTEMSNTAHQREVADLKAAGLNPVLSAGGSGATTGSGMMATRSDSNVDALYGLIKESLDAQVATAKAMANSAKYASGAAGLNSTANAISPDGKSITTQEVDLANMTFAQQLSYFVSIGHDAARDFAKRKLGISNESFEKLWNMGKLLFGSTVRGASGSGDEYGNVSNGKENPSNSYSRDRRNTGYSDADVLVTGSALDAFNSYPQLFTISPSVFNSIVKPPKALTSAVKSRISKLFKR